jgi:acyl carrier protein
MNNENIEDRVKKIITDLLTSIVSRVRPNKVIPSASIVADLGADSLDVIEIIMALEEEFDIEISDDAAEKCLTVQDAIDCVKWHV